MKRLIRYSLILLALAIWAGPVSANDAERLADANEMLRDGNNRAAFDAYTTAIIADPADANALNNRALAAIGLGDLEKALVDLTVALSLKPQNGAIWNNRANLNCLLKRYSDSIGDRLAAMQRGRFTAAAAQSGLRRSGYYRGPSDGIWGYDSDDALRDWTEAGCPDAPKNRPI